MRTMFISQERAERMIGTHDSAIISITSHRELADLKGEWGGILRLEFCDIDAPRDGCKLFGDKAARFVIVFLEAMRDSGRIGTIVVHCEAGVSRSAAVAKFIADMFDIGDFNHHYPLYNKHVYTTLHREWDRQRYGDQIIFGGLPER